MLWYFRYDSYFQLFLSNRLKHLHLKISCWTACLQVRKFWNFMLHGPTGRLSFRASAEQCFPSVRKVQLKWVFPDVSNQKMKKCRIKLFLKVYIYTLYGDVYFVYFIHTLFSVVLELILSLFWITHRQGALYSCLSLGPTESRLPGTPLSRVGVIWPHQMCSCACWTVSAQGGYLCQLSVYLCTRCIKFHGSEKSPPSVVCRHNWMRVWHCPGCRWALSMI